MEKDSSVDPISLAKCTGDLTTYRRGSWRVEGTAWGWWRMRGGRWSWWRGQGSQRERSLHACMEMTMGWMRQTREHLEPCDVCKEWVWQRKTTKTITTTRTFTCSCCASCWCFPGSWFSRCHWCRTPQRPTGRFHSSTAFHHAYAIPSAKSFSSGCCSPTVSCHRQLNLYPKFLHISQRENGSFEVLSLHTPSVTVDRPSAVNELAVTK